MRAAIYVRVSTDGQTTENQRHDLIELARLRGWEVVKEYADEGISGAKSVHQRPGLAQLMKDARRRRFDMVIVWSIDRLGRSVASVSTTMTDLSDFGVGLFAFKEAVDTSTAHGQAMLEMAAVFGKLERAMLVERTKAGLQRARAQGKQLGRPRVSPEVEQTILALRAQGHGIRKVAKEAGVGVSTVMRVIGTG